MSTRYVEIHIEEFNDLLKRDKGWQTVEDQSEEFTFEYRVNSNKDISIRVATSVSKTTGLSRRSGSDAIRVYAVYKPGSQDSFGLVSSKPHIKRTKNWRRTVERRVKEAITKSKNNLQYHSSQRQH